MHAHDLTPAAQTALDELVKNAMVIGAFNILNRIPEVQAVAAGPVGKDGSASDVVAHVLGDFPLNFNHYHAFLVQDFIDALETE